MRAYKEKDKILARMIIDRDDYEKMTPHKLFAKIQQHESEDAPTKARESHALVANEQESSKKSSMGKDHKSKKIVESFSDDESSSEEDTSMFIERELGLHLVPKMILVVELPNTNNWTN
jgi:hypothetical protein